MKVLQERKNDDTQLSLSSPSHYKYKRRNLYPYRNNKLPPILLLHATIVLSLLSTIFLAECSKNMELQKRLLKRQDIPSVYKVIHDSAIQDKKDNDLINKRKRRFDSMIENAMPCNLYGIKLCTRQKRNQWYYEDINQETKEYCNKRSNQITYTSATNDSTNSIANNSDSIEKSKTSAWPPWPLNLILNNNSQKPKRFTSYKSTAIVLYTYLTEKTSKTLSQLQKLTNAASFHLPPATIPLAVFSILPISNSNNNMYMLHLWTKRLSYAALSIAILSWAEYVTNKGRIPGTVYINGVYDDYNDIKNYVLPPFLPEYIPPPSSSSLQHTINEEMTKEDTTDQEQTTQNKTINNALQKTYNTIQTKTKTTYQKTKAKLNSIRTNRSMQQRYLNRVMIQQELLALQELKKNRNVGNSYAMVVGASRGLGRALSIELARYSIPLILISRNETELQQLSQDIRSYYGVPCHTIQTDLNHPSTPFKIFQTTTLNKWNVDYFIYNAGLCYRNDITSLDDKQVMRMMNVNMVSMTLLSKYYAAAMKARKKGRMLFISSIVGSIPSAPTVGVYAATKSYMTSYAYALAHEVSHFGVSVTCSSPGAIKDTSFATATEYDNANALCWKIPFYPKTPQEIAHRSISCIIGAETELDVVPGWQNRVLINFVQFVVSRRLMNVFIERCWNSWDWSRDGKSATFLDGDDFSFDDKLQSAHSSRIIRLNDTDDFGKSMFSIEDDNVEKRDVEDRESLEKNSTISSTLE